MMHDLPEVTRDQMLVTLELVSHALAELAQERTQLEEDIRRLQDDLKQVRRRTAELREFQRLGDVLLGEGTPILALPPVDIPATPAAVPKTAAQKAKAVLEEAGHPLSVKEIMTTLSNAGDLAGNQRESLKTALRTHPKLFTRQQRGRYGLMAWATRGADASA
jgi:HB1, ASXL, restriction endonuclease HTH domain